MTQLPATNPVQPAKVSDPRIRDRLKLVGFIGTYVPRKCGIATFTADLLHAVAAEAPSTRVIAVASNDVPDGYDYPPEVQFEIAQQRLADYRKAAEYLNVNEYDAVCVQHEFGIYGGTEGEHLVKLLGELRMPKIATLHTLLREPTPEQRRVLCSLAEVCDRLVVMSEMGRRFLEEIYRIPSDSILVIPHGVPDTPFLDTNFYKDKFGVSGKKVILTFGLLSPNKGIEVMLRALPRIVERHPDVVYVVLGATHPHIRRTQGEAYRLRLQQLARSQGVDKHVIFRDQFVALSQLCEYLGAADVYCTPYLNVAQITSGTLSYAMATGNAIVSTPYWHAEEMLQDGRGRLVPFNDSAALATEITDLLSDEDERLAIRRRAYDFTRSHTWKEVARRYLDLFVECRDHRRVEERPAYQTRTLRTLATVLPELKFDHLKRLTDDVGILQHATYSVPNRDHGYCTDDNARALLVTSLAQRHVPAVPQLQDLSGTYLSYLLHAFNPKTGMFRNFMGYDRCWMEAAGSEDSHARAVWALGETVIGAAEDIESRLATALLHKALPAVERFESPRAVSHALLGVNAFLRISPNDEVAQRQLEKMGDRLYQRYQQNASADWPWIEDELTYSNGAIAHALLAVGESLGRSSMREAGLESLDWLVTLQTEDGRYVPIGNQGWYRRGGERARFDQQPIEAASMIPACVEAYRVTGEHRWLGEAQRCFRWFTGENHHDLPMYDETTGACCDGLSADGLNQNRGAESTLAWLYSLIFMHALQSEGTLGWSKVEAEEAEAVAEDNDGRGAAHCV
ncbi:MAG: glycosyltransferase [Gemmatimonadetes bacterium]|nr:glycosyltransferase [Gemmatimonadota bacterium]